MDCTKSWLSLKRIQKYYPVLFLLWGVAPCTIYTQADTIIQAPQAEVIASKMNLQSRGSYVQQIDSQTMNDFGSKTLAQLLANRAGIFLKTYGAGSLATSALRGAGASHTTVLWNGFNLQNPMNGVIDFSLFPIWLCDGVNVQHGGGSSLHGSGSIGGAVFLENNLRYREGWKTEAGAGIGSFQDYKQFAKLAYSGGRYSGDLKFIGQQAENNFPLSASVGGKQQNAAWSNWAFSQNNYLKIKERQTVKIFSWVQKTGRNIPPSKTEVNTHARQEDDIIRLASEWSKTGNQSAAKARIGWFDEKLLYFSDVIDKSRSHSTNWIGEFEQSLFFSKDHILRLGVHLNRQAAQTIETGKQRRTRMAAYGAWQLNWWQERMTWGLELRQEMTDGVLVPFTASTGANFKLTEKWKLFGRLSKNFNLPTFNDLYWRDAFAQGNPDLKPETAWGQELGFHWRQSHDNSCVETGLTVFSNLVKNWIQWAPHTNIWKPENKRTVWARGVETFLQYNRQLSPAGFSVQTYSTLSLTRSTVEEIYDQDNTGNFLGKQLIYTPAVNGSAGLSVIYRRTSLSYYHALTGKRYTTSDNSRAYELPAFQIGTLSLSQTLPLKAWHVEGRFSMENVWNTRYEAIATRPMPGRHFSISVVISNGEKQQN